MKELDQNEANLRLFSEKNLLNKFGSLYSHENGQVITKPMRVGKAPLIPEVTKNLAVLLPGKGKDIAKALNISASEVSLLKSGKQPSEVFDKVQKESEATREEVSNIAVQSLMKSLKLIDDDKLSVLGAKDLAATAKNLSSVVRVMGPAEQVGAKTTLIIYAPKVRAVNEFEAIEVEGC